MITNFKCTTVNEELNIMNMDQGNDWEWCYDHQQQRDRFFLWLGQFYRGLGYWNRI